MYTKNPFSFYTSPSSLYFQARHFGKIGSGNNEEAERRRKGGKMSIKRHDIPRKKTYHLPIYGKRRRNNLRTTSKNGKKNPEKKEECDDVYYYVFCDMKL